MSMNLSIKDIEAAIQFRTVEPEKDHHIFNGYKMMVAEFKAGASVVYDPRYPGLEDECKKRLVREILDRIYQRRYSQIVRAIREFAASCSFSSFHELSKLQEAILGDCSPCPPLDYPPAS